MNRATKFVATCCLFVYGVLASQAVCQAPASNTWSPAGQLTQARSGAAAVLLNDGRVLITGGADSSGAPLATTEVYDPAKGTFTASAAMNAPRANHAAIVLKTGDVLVTGGLTTGGGYSDSAEIYSVSGKQWILLQSSMGTGLAYQAMAQLGDGNILIAGGTSTSKVVGSLLLFSLADQAFMHVGMLNTPRTNAVAAATPDGRVLIAGGTDVNGAVLASTEIFKYNKDTMTGSLSSGPTMAFPRVGATATSTYDGVAIVGGNNGESDLGSVEIFSQWTNTFKTVSGGTPRSNHFAALLPKNGSVLVMGGTGGAAVDLLQPWANKKAGAFVAAPNSPINQDGGFASPASRGSLLAAGGKDSSASAASLYWFPTIATDKPDYAPGKPVHMTGTGFQPLENVTLHIHEWVKQATDDDPDVTVTADSFGNFTYDGYAPDTDDLGARYHLTAVGVSSGYQAQVIFTDSIINLNFTNSPLDQATNVCGLLTIDVNAPTGYGPVYLTDSTNTGGFYTNANCTGAAVTQVPGAQHVSVWYKNSAPSTPTLYACSANGGVILCFLEGAALAQQNESIYGPPTQVVFTTQPGGGTPGAVWALQPVVAVQDANYNTVAANSDPITLTLTTNPGGTLSCASNPQNASSGAAAFSNCLVSGASSSSSCYRITAKDTTLNFSVVSNCFYIENAATAGNSTVSATPNPAVDNGRTPTQNPPGGSTITVTLKDSGGALLGNKVVTLTANNGTSNINTVSGTTNSSGVATFTVSDNNPEVVTYTATDVTDNVQKTVTVTFAPGPVSPADSTISARPTSVNADGVATSIITVTLQDSSGDNIAGETVTLTQGGANSVITPASGTTDANGQVTFTVKDSQVENVQYSATYSGANGSGSFSGPNPTVRFVAVGTSMTLNINPNSITFGTTPVVLTAGLSVTSGGAPVGGVSISFYRGAVGSSTCTTGSTLLATVATDGTGSTTPFSYNTSALPVGVYRICAFTPTPTFTANNITYSASSASGSSFTLTVGQASNFVWTAPVGPPPGPPASAIYNTSFTPTASSPSGAGHSPCTPIAYGVSGGACSLSGQSSHVVTMTSGGGLPPGSLTCTVTATLPACTQTGVTYATVTLTSVVTPVLATQATLNLTNVPPNAGDGATFTPTVSGGSGTGAVTLSTSTPTVCFVSGNQVTMTATGGAQTCTITATKASDGNYASATSAPKSTLSDGSAVVQITNTTQTYTGSPLPVTVTTIPPGLSYSVVYSGGTCGSPSDPNCPTQGPTLVGTYSVFAQITTSGITGSNSATETVNQLGAGLVLAIQTGTTNPSPYGRTAYFTLNMSVSNGSCPTGTVQLAVGGTLVGSPVAAECSTPILLSAPPTIEPGVYNVVAQFIAVGDPNHSNGNSNPISFTVSADTTSVTLTSTTVPVFVGQSITFTATVGPTSLDPSANGPLGTVQFYDGATPLGDPQLLSSTSPYTASYTATLPQGSHSITATYIPGSDAEFAGSSSAIEVAVVQYITPVLAWPTPDSIVYGTSLSNVQLNASATDPVNGNATVAGVFTYTPAAGTVLAVGTTTLSVSFQATDTATFGTVPVTMTVPITITGATLLVTADNQTMPYGGPIPTLTATITGFVAGDVPSQVTGTASCTTNATLTTPVSGNPYAINCTLGSLAEPNYTFTFAPGTLTETLATPTVSLGCQEVTYDGNPHGCQGVAIGADGITPVAGGSWSYNPTSETNPGSYPVTGTFTGTDPNYVTTPLTASATLVIDIATSSVTLTCPSSVPYTGAAQTPCTATAVGSGGLNQTLTVNYTNNTNAGTATATATFGGDTGHTGSSNSTTFAIAPVGITVAAGSYTGVYAGTTPPPIPACTIGGAFTTGLTCSESPTTAGPDVGTGPVTVTLNYNGLNPGNFTVISSTNGTWTITPATPSISVTCNPLSLPYNGSAQTPCSATVTGVGGVPLTPFSLVYTNNVDGGLATATASYAGSTDYSAGSNFANFTITAVAVTATAGSYNAPYDGSTHAPSPCVITGAAIGVSTLSCTNNPASVGPAVGGPTAILPVVSGANPLDFTVNLVNGSYTISKFTPTVAVSCPASVVYNGAAQTPCTATATGAGGVSLTPVTLSYTSNTNQGTATATANYAGTADYAAVSNFATFIINPALVTATAGSLNGVYNGSTQAPSPCVITGAAIGVSTLTCTDSPASVGPGVGGPFAVTPVVNGNTNGNFTVTPVNGSWTISPKVETITLGNLAQFFTGSPATPVTVQTSPDAVAVSVLYGTTGNPNNATSSQPPTAVGNYAVSATPTNPNFVGTGGPWTLSITSATTGLNLVLRSGAGEPSLYGTLVYFDLTLTGTPCPTGTVTWNLDGVAQTPVTLPPTCSIPVTFQTDALLPGSHQVFAVFTSGDANYTSGTSNTVTHGVAADTSTVSLSGPLGANVSDPVTFTALVVPKQTPQSDNLVFGGRVDFFDGATLIGSGTLSQINADLYLATFTTTTLAAGSHTISATFVPNNPTEYPGSSSTLNVTVAITQIVPKITWATPGSIVYGTPLSGTQLNATATDAAGNTVNGTFTYNPAAGALVPAGNVNTLSATFHPTNTTIYTSPTTTVNLVVTPATLTLSLTCPATTYNGNPQQTCVGSATTSIPGGAAPAGTWTFNPATETEANTYSITGTYTSTNPDYLGGTAPGTLVINKAPVTARAGSYSAVYDGSSHAPSACAVTGAFTGNLTCTNNPASVGPAVGGPTAVLPVVSGSSLTDFVITSVNGSWSITKATSTVTVSCPGTFTYNGAAQTPCTATVTGAGGLNQAVTPVTYTNNTNAGTATASATYAGDANHAASSTATANFTISPAPVTATAGSYNATYDGAAHATAPACSVTGPFKGTLTCVNNPATVGPAVGGPAAVTPTVSGGTLTNFAITSVNGSWSITKASSTVTVNCPASVTYNGAAQTPCTANVTGAGGFTQSLTVSYTNNTNAGTATANASFAGDASHTASSNSATFTINPAAVTATAGSFSGVYNGAARTPTACTVTGAFTGGITCTNNPASVGPAVGSGTITPTVTGGSTNFTITRVNGAWTITQATSTVTLTCPASVTYNGAAQTPCTARVTGAGGLNQALTPVTYTNNTNAGTATASASFAGDANHSASSNTANFTINRAPVTATAGGFTGVYDGASHATAPACAVTGAFTGGITCTNNPASVGPAVGSGAVTPTVTGGSANFIITSVNGAWSITRAPSTVVVTCPASVTYNGAAQTPCTARVTSAGGLNQAVTPVTYTNNTNAGTATASASFAGDTNHAPGSSSTNFTINRAAVTATAGSYSGAYDGASHATAPACAVTGAFTGGLACTNNPASVGPAAGSGAVTPTVTGATGNFTVTSVNGAWSITQASTVVTVTCPASVGYSGAAQTPCTATVTGAGGLSQALTVTYTNNTNAGTATASASFAGDVNHAASSNSATFLINAAPVTATAGSFSGVYNGATRTPSACTVTGAFTGGITCTNNPASVGPAVGSGTVTPTVIGGGSNFAITPVNGTWSITQASSLVTVTCPASVTYNGAAQTPCTATVTGAGGLSQSLTVTYTNNTNAGTATANASFAGDANHAASNNSATFAINAAAVTATAGSYTGVYDGSSHAPSACAVTGAFTGGLSCTNSPTPVGPAVGSGTVTPTVSGGTANFTITAVNGAWSITQASSVVTVTCPASVTYNGAAQTPCTAAVTGTGGLNQSLTVTYTNNTNAGTATASASFAGDANHAAGNNSATFTINPAAVTATAGSFSGVYNGLTRTPSACTVTGVFTDSLSCANNPASVGPAVGSGTVVPVVSGGTLTNFTITPVNGAWSITQGTSSVTVSCPASVGYNGAAQTPCTATVTGSGGFSQTLTVTYTNNTNAGTATASASFAGDANHTASNNTANFTINPAAVTATAGSYSAASDGSAHAPSACAVTGSFTGGLSCTNNPASVGPAVGSGTVLPVVSGGSANFAITLVNGSWNITQGALTPTTTTVTCPASVLFNGAAQTPCTATVTGSGGLSQSLTVSYANNTNAGTATASASYAGDTTYASSSNTATFTINPVAVTATAGGYSAAYDGSAHAPSACAVTGTFTGGLSCTNNPASVGPAVGSGTVVPVVSGGTLTNFTITPVNGAWSITQGTSSVTVSCPASVGYNGAAQTPCTATVTGSGGLSQSLTVSYTNNTNAGTATASASFAGDANHTTSNNTANFTINPAAVTATAGSYNGTSDGSAHSPSACAVTGSFTGGLSCTNNPASVGPAVGSGTVLPVVSGGTANFAITLVNGSWNITQGALTPTTTTVSCPASVGYNGAAQTPCTATVTGAGGLSQSLTVGYTNNTNAGTATASASYAGNTTYAASSNTANFTINPAAVTATAGSYNGASDGSAHSPSACAVTGTFTGSLSCTNNPASVGPAVGSGAVLPVMSGGTANFAITPVNGAWSITLATSSVTVSCPASVGYNGVAQTPCTATVTGPGGLNQSLTVSYTSNTNAGTATANASFAGDASHVAGSNSATFAINPAPVTATAGSYTGVVDASTHAPSACAVTGAFTGTLTCANNPASVGPAVGSGAVLPVVSGGTLSNFAITAVNGAWSITQASSTTTVTCPSSVLYNGLAQTPCTATVTGSGGLSQSLTVSYTNNTNAGTATANASFAGDASHAASSNSATFAINPAAVTATAGSYNGVVDASSHAPSACVVTGAFTGTLTCANNPASVGPAVGSGTVLPVVSGGSLSNFTVTLVNGSWSISVAAASVTTVTCPASVGYNGAAQTPCTAVVTGSGGLNQSLTVSYTNNTNAGTATASATFAGDASHAGSSNSSSFAISPAAVTATAGSYTGVVDASTHAPSACAVTGAFTGTLSCTNNPASVGPAVGSGVVLPVVSGGTLSNFAITAVNGAWSITPAPTSVTTVTCPASVLYNGLAQTPCTAVVTGSGGLNQSLTVSYTSNTNAGTATANASFAGDATHPASSNSATFAINPAPVTATAGSYTGVVDASTHAPSACAVTGAFTGTLSCTNNPASVGPAVGSGVVLPVVSGGTLSNFAITAVNGAWSITPAPTSVTTVTCPASVLFNGAAQTPCTAVVTGSGGLNQSLTVSYTSNTNAGTATANASFAGDATHPASSNSATFAINPAPVTATAGSYTGVVDASTHAPSACAVTGAFTGTLSCTNNPASVGPAVGSGTVLPVVSGGTLSNFAITAVNGAWSITQPSTSATTVSCPASVLYNGLAQTPCTATVTGSGGLNQSLPVNYTNNTNAGTATANASFAGDASHPASSNSATFAINPAPVTATAGSYSGVVDATTHAPSACAVTGTFTGTLTCTNNPASVGPAVGSGTVLPVVSGGTLSNFAITAVNGAWNISPASSTATTVTCPASVLFNGAAQTPCTATVTGSGGFSQALTVSYTNNTNAGTATANASFAGDATHPASSNSATFAINPAPVTATAGSYSGVVDASTHAPSACAVTGAFTGTLACTNNPASVGPAVGSGAVLPVVSGGTLSNFAITAVNGAWNITLAPSTTTVTCPASVGYNGLAQTPCTALVTGAGGLSQSLTVSYTNNTNAGTATANASFAGDATHATSNNSATFAINPAAVTATAGSYTGVVDASTHAPSACAVTGAFTGTLTCTNNPASVGPAVGSGAVLPVVSGGTLSNFAITAVNGAWSITAAASSTTTAVSCPASVGYNGAAQTPCTATVTGSGGFSQTLTVSYTNNTNAGTATANASFAGDATHAASNNSATFAINPAAVTATAGSYTGAVDASTHAPSACAVTGAFTGTLSCTNNPASVGPAIGSGTVIPVVSGGTLSNFAITAVNGAWSITAAASTTTAVSCPASVIYNGAAQTPCTATVTGSGGFSQSLTVSYTNNTNAGTATANASFAGDATHPASSNSATFTIAKASQAITFTQPTSPVIFGVSPIGLIATGGASGKPVVFSIDPGSTASGAIGGSTLTVTGVGNLIIDANQAGDSNYLAATQVTRAIVVDKGALTLTANNASRVYGANNPAFTGNMAGAVSGDVFTESYSTTATISSNVGTYPIVPSVTGANLPAYTVTVQNGTLTVTQAGTATSMTTSSPTATPGQNVTLTALVAPATTGTPTGSVSFYDGAALLGTVPLTAGTASLSTSALTPGSTNVLQAVYSGDGNFTTSSSSTSSVSVASLDFTLAVAGSASVAVSPGTAATYLLAVTPLYGTYPGTVNFSGIGLPFGGSITFSPSTIPAGGGKQTVAVTVHTAALAKEVAPPIGRKLAPLSLALLLIPLLGVGRLRRQGRRLSRLASLLLLLGCTLTGVLMTGCGGRASLKQIEQNYTITVTATSGNMQHSTPVTLTVK